MRHGFRLASFVVIIYLPFLALCAVVGWMVARGLLANAKEVLLIPFVGMLIALYAILYAARRQFCKRFLAREPRSFEQWRFERGDPLGI